MDIFKNVQNRKMKESFEKYIVFREYDDNANNLFLTLKKSVMIKFL